jgi:cyclophilin family peptidyl-prolyl cis-trans isomerase
MRTLLLILLSATLFAIGCANQPAEPTSAMKPHQIAILETNLGTIKIQFFPDKAPGHVKNFIDLAKKGFYDGTRFHRVIPGFMIQGGDPLSKKGDRRVMGTGGPGYTIKAEFNDVKHERGILSMARSSDPNSAGSQFFIMVANKTHLDGQYSAFGKVISGMDVVDKIVNLERDENDNPLEKNPAIIKHIKIVEEK